MNNNILRYAEIRTQINQLQAEAQTLEPEIIATAKESGEKGFDTELGRVGTVATYIYHYSDELLAKKKASETAIKEFSDSLKNPIKELVEAEEKNQEPEIKLSIRFIPAKEKKA